ncbi:MAG: aa3-type cytochrome c oxidase subunit IV [Pseudomonadota bacterium]
MSTDLSGGHPDMDYAEHKKTYSVFIKGTQILVVVVTLILVGMYVFLV